jgi:hypothetical protein
MWDEDDNNDKNQLNSLSYYETDMHLFAYIDKMDQRIEKCDLEKDKHKIYSICMEMGQNLFDRSYYTMTDSTPYLNLWKYWINSHGIYINNEYDLDYIWDHIFM